MKLPPIMDAEDVGVILAGFVFAISITGVMVGFAAVLGLAWTVFKLAGGL